jgi:hypothetical protein
MGIPLTIRLSLWNQAAYKYMPEAVIVDILLTVIESSYSLNLLHKAPEMLSFHAKAVEKSAFIPRAGNRSLGPVAFSTGINRAPQ